MAQQTFSTDVVIIGAGIAGLWLHNRLNQMGFHALLLENNTIGNAQTLSSQGIIHGGAKYALNGILSKATQAIGDMPARWQACLAGQGDVDLTGVNVLADHQLMWSKDQLSSKMLSFFASKALASRMQPVPKPERPKLFQYADFKGTLYQLDEPVLDVASVLKCLAKPYQDRILHTPKDRPMTWQQQGKTIQSVQLGDGINIKAQHFVLTAGEGIEGLLQSLNLSKPAMQRRPLQMALCKAKDKTQSLPAIYAHSLGSGSKPIATITSHADHEGNIVWYIGGNIAENGVNKPLSQLSAEAEALLADIMPWYQLPELEWAGHAVNRAEPKQSSLTRPDAAFVDSKHNVHIAWPTKLALAPDLADQVIKQLTKQNLQPKSHDSAFNLKPAIIGETLWNTAFQ
jgi:glycine/D-amino acid oxidase-like deaminating enzyme